MTGMGVVVALHVSATHSFSKASVAGIDVIAGLGAVGDAHSGGTVRHRSRVAADPTQPNLRQIHLIPAELFDQLNEAGHSVVPGELGENITTRGIELYDLPTGTLLRFGDSALLALTGLRNPCVQIEAFQTGLLKRVVSRDSAGNTVRSAGVMSVVVQGGTITVGDPISIALPPPPHIPLSRV